MGIQATHADIGRSVVYQGGHPDDRDEGVITSLGGGGLTVFVRYRSQHPSAAGQATSPDDLEWAFGSASAPQPVEACITEIQESEEG